MLKTSIKRPLNPFRGAVDGKPFTKKNQPTPEAKSMGWQEKRAERLLTQKIMERMTRGKALDLYVESLYINAKLGHAKAIDTINRGIEDDILKIEHSGSIETPITIKLDARFTDDPGIS